MDGNPFRLKVAARIASVIEEDLKDLGQSDARDYQINKAFLTDPDSRVELVGIVNRMDRQFIKDKSQGLTLAQRGCGEISLIYRFGYSLRDRDQKSRLPVTLNVVLPALPTDTKNGSITCQSIANRWLAVVPTLHSLEDIPDPDAAKAAASSLMASAGGPLAFIDGRDIIRIELNIQAYRKPAGIVQDFGTEAAYAIRVFKWLPKNGYFDPDILRNQVDRRRVLCMPDEPGACAANEVRRKKLVAYLSDPEVVQSIDWGTLEIDRGLGVLATRGISVSPGGSHRSLNQVYFNAKTPTEQVISDKEIDAAIQYAKSKNIQLSFIKSVDDFRTRLNESTCTGCHQTRAIAGFHFPGSDRAGTSRVNSVLLPGSPQFYGDQPRRLEILAKIAAGRKPSLFELAIGYSGRPMNRFADALRATKLLGGWGGTCLTDDARKESQRQWTCHSDLACVPLYQSENSKGVGTCVPRIDQALASKTMAKEIGDAVQRGAINSSSYGKDRYERTFPEKIDGKTLILPSNLPSDPPGNSYYGAHQEYHKGKVNWDDRNELRDAKTGGFPSGMLRLSECIGLPDEATCGLIASTGFNDCVEHLGEGTRVDGQKLTIDICFRHFTSFAGLRACTAGSPCRDDYICVKPSGYSAAEADKAFEERKQTLLASKFFPVVNKHKYNPDKLFGQSKPDEDWLARDDRRGLCIPPYFVFQFRADGHPGPRIATSP